MNNLLYIKKLFKTIKKYNFEIVGLSCFVFLLCYSIYRRNKIGTWSTTQPILFNNFDMVSKTQKRKGGDSSGETECRRVLEKIFNKKFDKIRPDFLRNPVTGNNFNLELDCYNDELKLAVEYQGCQHYKYTPYFHKNKEAFLNQKYRDLFKKQQCKENGIYLIEVPYTIKNKDIEKYIIIQLKIL